MIADVEKGKGTKASSSKKVSDGKREVRKFLLLPSFLYRAKKATAFLEQWFKDRVIPCLGWNFSIPSPVRKKQRSVRAIEEKAIHWSSVLLS